MKDLVRPPALTLLCDLSLFLDPDFFLSSSSEFCALGFRDDIPGLVRGLEILGTESVRGKGALATADVDLERGLEAEVLPLCTGDS
jgi:hypothetical protein